MFNWLGNVTWLVLSFLFLIHLPLVYCQEPVFARTRSRLSTDDAVSTWTEVSKAKYIDSVANGLIRFDFLSSEYSTLRPYKKLHISVVESILWIRLADVRMLTLILLSPSNIIQAVTFIFELFASIESVKGTQFLNDRKSKTGIIPLYVIFHR
jgi:hypothetical protein